MKSRKMFLLLVAMVVLTTQSSARVFPTRSLVDNNDDVVVRDEDLQKFYDNLMNYLTSESAGVNGDDMQVFDGSISPANAPEPTPVPEPSNNHNHKDHHKHGHDENHHKHEHEHHHHKHEHKDHQHKHNYPHHEPQALPPTAPTFAPTPAESPESFLT